MGIYQCITLKFSYVYLPHKLQQTKSKLRMLLFVVQVPAHISSLRMHITSWNKMWLGMLLSSLLVEIILRLVSKQVDLYLQIFTMYSFIMVFYQYFHGSIIMILLLLEESKGFFLPIEKKKMYIMSATKGNQPRAFTRLESMSLLIFSMQLWSVVS